MKKYKVTYLVGWRSGWGADPRIEIVEAKDFEDAMNKAKSKEWHSDAYAKIEKIEEIDLPPVYVNDNEVYSTAEEILSGNTVFFDALGVRRFLDKYIDDICQDIRASANSLRGWCVDDVYLAIKRIVAMKLEIED